MRLNEYEFILFVNRKNEVVIVESSDDIQDRDLFYYCFYFDSTNKEYIEKYSYPIEHDLYGYLDEQKAFKDSQGKFFRLVFDGLKMIKVLEEIDYNTLEKWR